MDPGPRLFTEVITLSPTAMALLEGPEHRYAEVNAAFRALARGKGELVGRSVAEVWPEAGPEIVRVLDRVFETGEPFQARDQPIPVVRDGGPETIWLTFSLLPARDGAGRVQRILVMANDVTEHVRALATLQASNELTAALSSAHTRAEVAQVVCERGLAALGADAGAVGLLAGQGQVEVEMAGHLGYPASLVDAWGRRPLSLRCPANEAIRLVQPVWVSSAREAVERFPEWARWALAGSDRAWAAVPLTARGKVLGAIGLSFHAERTFEPRYRELVRSVAERCAQALDRAQALDDARARAAELEAVLDAVPAPVFITRDLEAHRIEVNRAAQALLGVGPGANASLRGPAGARPPFQAMRDGHPIPLDELPMQAAARFGVTTRDLEYDIVRQDGSVRRVVANAQPIVDAAGVRRGAVGAFTDVTVRREAEQAVRENEARLREADRRKTEFLAVLSHELRTPLTPIRNGLVLLERAPPGSPAAARAREVLERQTAHLVRLVDDLLDVTRISHGKVELRRTRIDLRELARRGCEDHRALLEGARIALRLELPEGPVQVDGDPDRLCQVIGNLLQNAAKFTPEGGDVRVAVEAGPAGAVLTVRDSGIGIAAEDLPRLFEPFAQAAQGLARTRGGLGLGLALARSLAELHGGSVQARSDGPGRGAAFALTLPLAGPTTAPSEPVGERAGPAAPRSILLIEDNPDAAQTLADVLELQGHEVRLAPDGRSGLALARAARPDLVLCDIGLPDLDGYAVARALRADGALAATRLVALSGYAQPEDLARARAAGFDDHVAKPPDPEALLGLVARLDAAPR